MWNLFLKMGACQPPFFCLTQKVLPFYVRNRKRSQGFASLPEEALGTI